MYQKTAIGTIPVALAIFALLVIGALGLLFVANYYGSPPTEIQTTSSSNLTSSTCSGYPPGGDCFTNYSYTFTVSLNYSGSWKLTYQGYNSLGEYNPTGVSGSYNGTGSYSIPITVSGLSNQGLSLCATAQKLDATNATLVLTITASNETSLPYGSAFTCGGVAP
jgi:hypothetical protein